jgi:hypothetical protein
MNLLLTGFLSTSLLVALPSQAQIGRELVRNGGFELIDGKLNTFDQLKAAMGWNNVNLGLSEVFSKDAPAKTIGIPANDYGTIEPKDGEHYAGLFAWKDDMRRNWSGGAEDPFEPGWNVYSEYLQSELVAPLVEGKTYELTFWVALSGNSDRAVSGLGAYCAPFAMHEDNRRFLQERPNASTDKILNKKGEWVRITERFVADGGESFIIIGVFPYVGFDTQRMVVDYDNQYAYYYVDAISLQEVEPAQD